MHGLITKYRFIQSGHNCTSSLPHAGMDLLREMATYKKKCLPLQGNLSYFVRRQKNGKCNSLTISGTTLQEIPDKVWKECKDLKIVILYMNHLFTLPQELSSF